MLLGGIAAFGIDIEQKDYADWGGSKKSLEQVMASGVVDDNTLKNKRQRELIKENNNSEHNQKRKLSADEISLTGKITSLILNENNVNKKRVSFADNVKQHDGLRKSNLIFDQLIVDYFIHQEEITMHHILNITSGDSDELVNLHSHIIDLCTRVVALKNKHQEQNEIFNSTPVLPKGGGYGIKLGLHHLPYLISLRKVIEYTCKRSFF